MLALSQLSLGLSTGLPAVNLVQRAAAPTMIQSKALPFLEAPPKLDGTLAGDNGFDPWGFSELYSLDYMREAELKHGRICQLAATGFVLVDLGFRAPGAPAVSSIAAHDVTVKSGHMLMLLFAVAIVESLSYSAIYEMMSGETDRQPGDYGLGSYFKKDPVKFKKFQEQEIAHCRLAMMGFSGMVTQSVMFDCGFPYFG